MVHRLIIIAAVLIICCTNFSVRAEVHSYPFAPEIGTTWIVHETRTKTTNQEGKSPQTEGEVYGILTVTGDTPDGYLYEWTTTEVHAGGVVLTKENADPSFMIGLAIPFEAAADGTPIKISDVDQVIENAMSAIAVIGEEVPEEVRIGVTSMFTGTDPRTVAATLLSQAELVGTCQNYELEYGNPIEQEAYSQSFDGAPPILTKYKVELHETGDKNRPAVIVNEQYFDPESARASMIGLFAKLSADMGQPAPDDDEIPPIARSTKITCRVDTISGETLSVVSNTEVSAQGIENTDFRKVTVTRKN